MADVSFERRRGLSRQEAAGWLSALSQGLARGEDVELPVGDGGTVTLRLPDEVRAEFEVEVNGDEVELEFTWSLTSAPS